MKVFNKREPFILFMGDLVVFTLALWVALALRYAAIPSQELLMLHVLPFSILFVVWVLAFFIAGLYEKHTLVFKHKLPALILNTQIINSIVAVVFFYLIPISGVTPKTVLVLYLGIFFVLLVSWRTLFASWFGARHREEAVLVGSGAELHELEREVNNNGRYNLVFKTTIDIGGISGEEALQQISGFVEQGIRVVVIDFNNEKTTSIPSSLYETEVRLVAVSDVYEEVFERVPLSAVDYKWFLENASSGAHMLYDSTKRFIDIVASSILGTLSLLVYPFVALAIKIEDGGPVFIIQERIGYGGQSIFLWKFRSMKSSDNGVWLTENDNRVTKVGKFLRQSRIDELPQLWNVVRGDISLIGPRPDIIGLGKELMEKLPYYTMRTLIKPGLSGWAQLKQELPPQSVEETRLRLAYDLYYLKNRSMLLDIVIALKTVKVLLSRTGL